MGLTEGPAPTLILAIMARASSTGIVIALVILEVVREPKSTAAPAGLPIEQEAQGLTTTAILRQRNVWVSVAIASLLLGYLTAGIAFMPLYFIEARGLSSEQMSVLMSLIGFCILTAGAVVPALSDRFGRKPVAVTFSLLGIISPLACLYFDGPMWVLGVLIFVGWMAAPIITLAIAASVFALALRESAPARLKVLPSTPAGT